MNNLDMNAGGMISKSGVDRNIGGGVVEGRVILQSECPES